MNGLEELESKLTKLYDDFQHYTMVERDRSIARQIKDEIKFVEWCIMQARLNKILKEKKVDLHWIMRQWAMFYLAIEDGSSWISHLLFDYNERFGTSNAHLHLTLEEIIFIVDWIREKE